MAEKNIVPNLETKATVGNLVFTLRQFLERLKPFTKREHKCDITPQFKGEEITNSGWAGREQTIKKLLSGEWDPKHFFK